jgi:DNA repair photolyase
MTVRETEARSILLRHKRIDSWFVSHYGMNLYRGCLHDCAYCDGRAEGYYVEGEFGRDVTVKTNALKVLQRELDPARKRTPWKPSFILLGGGVGDGYQPLERKYELTRGVLRLICNRHLPVHVLTKSTLVLRDLDLLSAINQRSRAIVSFSFSSVDDEISRIFEPGVPPPSERLRAISRLKQEGIACGMFPMPLIPLVTDTADLMEDSFRKTAEAGVDFVIFGGMTLKQGRQMDHFRQVAGQHFADLPREYDRLYRGDRWGRASATYYDALNRTLGRLAGSYGLPRRMPPALYSDILSENDLVIVILEHLDFLLALEGQKSSYRFGANSIAALQVPVSQVRSKLRDLSGIGPATERIILEIVDTGRCRYYEGLL